MEDKSQVTILKINNQLLDKFLTYSRFKEFKDISDLQTLEVFLPLIIKKEKLLQELVHHWIKNKNRAPISILLQHDKNFINKHYDGKTMLWLAVENIRPFENQDSQSFIDFLLVQDNIDPNICNLSEVEDKKRIQKISPLMRAARGINDKGYAHFDNNVVVLKALSKHKKTNLKAVDGKGWLALHHCCDSYYSTMLDSRFLCESYIEAINYQHTSESDTPLLVASKGNTSHISVLLEMGADITAIDKNGNTALHNCCSRQRNKSCVASLLADPKITKIINLENFKGDTPLVCLLKTLADCVMNPEQIYTYPVYEDDDGGFIYKIPFDEEVIENLIMKGANPYIKITYNNQVYDIYSFMELLKQIAHPNVKSRTKEICDIIEKAIKSCTKNFIPEVVSLLLTNDPILCNPKNINEINEKLVSIWIDHQEAIYNEFEKRIKTNDPLAIKNLQDIQNSKIFSLLNLKKYSFFSSFGSKLLNLKSQHLQMDIEMIDMSAQKRI